MSIVNEKSYHVKRNVSSNFLCHLDSTILDVDEFLISVDCLLRGVGMNISVM